MSWFEYKLKNEFPLFSRIRGCLHPHVTLFYCYVRTTLMPTSIHTLMGERTHVPSHARAPPLGTRFSFLNSVYWRMKNHQNIINWSPSKKASDHYNIYREVNARAISVLRRNHARADKRQFDNWTARRHYPPTSLPAILIVLSPAVVFQLFVRSAAAHLSAEPRTLDHGIACLDARPLSTEL